MSRYSLSRSLSEKTAIWSFRRMPESRNDADLWIPAFAGMTESGNKLIPGQAPGLLRTKRGFTLLEVMLGLTLGVLVLGGVMGSISASMNFSQRIKERSQIQPVLEAAAQEILAHPEKADQGSMTVGTFPSNPVVSIGLSDVIGTDGKVLRIGSGELYRVVLSYRGSILELSLIVPRSQFK